MKRMLSLMLAGTMLVSMMPTTAFAKGDISAVAKVVGAMEVTKAAVEANHKRIDTAWGGVPELQIKVKEADYVHNGLQPVPDEMEMTILLDNAEFPKDMDLTELIHVVDDDRSWVIYDGVSQKDRLSVSVDANDIEEDEVTFTFSGNFEKDDIIVVSLQSVMENIGQGRTAAVRVESEMVETENMTYVSIVGKALRAYMKKMETIGVEETAKISSSGLKIKAAAGDLPEELKLRLSKGFEYLPSCSTLEGKGYSITIVDDDELLVTVEKGVEEITIKDIEIESVTAREGDVASIRITAKDYTDASVDVLKVIDADVTISVDEDEDIPVIYSGVGVDNYGLTDDSDHLSLDITLEESFPGAWDTKKAFRLQLPSGVYVAAENEDGITGVDVKSAEGLYIGGSKADPSAVEEKFLKAYQNGDYLEFEFKRKTFDHRDASEKDKAAKLTFILTLVADPDFEGAVDLTLTGDAVEEQTVTVAEFAKPYTVQAEQNELKIDYRHTEVPSSIVVTEAEAGLWEKKEAVFAFSLEKGNVMQFEKDAAFQVDGKSEMKINDSTNKKNSSLGFQVKETSEEEKAAVTISGLELYLSRDIPAGLYDLLLDTSMEHGADMETSFTGLGKGTGYLDTELYGGLNGKDKTISDVTDYKNVAKDGFINIITPGRDEEGFTTKVVVPVGENYIKAGEKEIMLDVPAYISEGGYTMLPVRAVAEALGISSSAVLWEQSAKTVTILHGQRIISMKLGEKYVTVNGSRLPAASAVEIVDGRTFLPMRDLATALGVTDITWDAAARTATLNGNK